MSLPESTPALLFGLQNRPDILEEVLISSIHGEKFLDVEFRAPSRRLATGGVGGFKPILANSTILKAVSPYFAELLADREVKKPAAAQFSVQGDSAETIFDYDDECDSDLEDEPASDGSAGAAPAVSSQPSKYDASSKARAGSVSEGESESDWQSLNETVFSRPTTSDSGRRVVYMKDIAANTMEALILYLYTGKVYFLPPKSSGIQAKKDAITDHTLGNTRNRPMCSAKSMYHIADKMGMADLRAKARDSLLSNTNEKNILEEYFSLFASKHREIREMLLRQLRKHHWSKGMASKIDDMVDRLVQGDAKHSGPALRLLIREIPSPEPFVKEVPLVEKPSIALSPSIVDTSSSSWVDVSGSTKPGLKGTIDSALAYSPTHEPPYKYQTSAPDFQCGSWDEKEPDHWSSSFASNLYDNVLIDTEGKKEVAPAYGKFSKSRKGENGGKGGKGEKLGKK